MTKKYDLCSAIISFMKGKTLYTKFAVNPFTLSSNMDSFPSLYLNASIVVSRDVIQNKKKAKRQNVDPDEIACNESSSGSTLLVIGICFSLHG